MTLVLLGISAGALAETVYVSDRLEASLRRGDGTKFQILRMVRSGDALEKLEETSSGYTKVRTPGGTEGYILSRYLMDQPAAREQIDAVSAENQQLRQTIAKLETRLVDLQSLSQDQSGQINSLESEKQQLGDELSGIREATADVMSIKRQNVALGKQVEQLNSEKEALATENRAYRDNTKQDWFIRGAGVVIVGILIGLILPKLRRRRRWGEL
ncbi:MAG: TIGR04211 family SH3 domain-containing protein [Gammaproteobacteria bacterium]|nr:TIGR04211 family SH3 domain-containing protein [Gammaproteobacteria bacterium]